MIRKVLMLVIIVLLSAVHLSSHADRGKVNHKIKRLVSQLYDRSKVMDSQRKLCSYGPEVTEYILPVLKEKGNDSARIAALRVLAKVEDESAEDDVVVLLKDPNHRVRQEAARTLGVIVKKDSTVDALKRLLGDYSPNVRYNALRAMASMARAKDADVFISALGDYDPRIRKFAVIALGKLKSKEAVPALAQLTRDIDPEARRALVISLGEIGTADCLQPLVWMISDPVPGIRVSAVEEIGRLKAGDTEAALVEAAGSMYPDIVSMAIRVLTDRKSNKVVAIAKEHIDDEYMVIKMASIYAIGKMGNKDDDALLTGLLDAESTKVRREAGKALAEADERK